MKLKILITGLISLIIITCGGIIQTASAQDAQPSLLISESTLDFTGLVGETLQRTVTLSVSEGTIMDLQIIVPDLIDPGTKRVILSDRISVNPPDIPALAGNIVLTITLTGLDRYGVYEGDLVFKYPGMPAENEPKIHLVVNLSAVPSVDTDVNSKSATLFAEPSLLDFPFGTPQANPSSPILGETVLSLVQIGESPATISDARVLAMQSSTGRTLPEDSVSVASEFPISMAGNDAVTLSVVARGKNLPAGEYNGTLLVNVENQSVPVQIPLSVMVKDGPILAFFLLAIGPIIGVLFFYWNKDGRVLLASRQRINNLQRVLREGRLLTRQDQNQIKLKLDGVMDAILNKADTTDVEAKLIEIEDFIKTQQATGEQYVLSLQNFQGQFESIQVGKTLRDDYVGKIKTLEQQLENGSASSWEAVQSLMDELQSSLSEMQGVIQEFQGFPNEKQAMMGPRLDKARTLDEFRGVISESRDLVPRAIQDLFKTEAEGERPEWRRFTLVLQWRRLAVSAVVYLFTLFVGWITLYASSPTFGANREDYITLFLWGVASNLVGGQAVDLKSIFIRQGDANSMP